MLIGASLLILCIIVIFSLILGADFTSGVIDIAFNNEGIINGTSTTFSTPEMSIFYNINTADLSGAIFILTITLVGMAAATGIMVVSTGLNAQSSRIIVLATIYGTLWWLLSILAYGLIISIEIYGGIIYVFISITYIIGAIQKISGGN